MSFVAAATSSSSVNGPSCAPEPEPAPPYTVMRAWSGDTTITRSPAETQSEFAERAHKFLSGHGPLTQHVAQVPGQVVNAFYRVRFGHLELEPASLEELDARLDALEASLKSR